jgi:hypothetical protein
MVGTGQSDLVLDAGDWYNWLFCHLLHSSKQGFGDMAAFDLTAELVRTSPEGTVALDAPGKSYHRYGSCSWATAVVSTGKCAIWRRAGRQFNNQRASARHKIIIFYLRMLERGKEEGLERKPSITPSQYRALLGKALPEVEDEVDGMTASFIEARYTSHEINEEWAGQVQRLWKRILQALRGKKKK